MSLVFRETHGAAELLRVTCGAERIRDVYGNPTLASSVDVLAQFGHLVFGLTPHTDTASLIGKIVCATDRFLDSPVASELALSERADTTPRRHQLRVEQTHYAPSALPYRRQGHAQYSTGLYLRVAANNLADHVAFGSLQAPAFGYDGSFMEMMSVASVIIAPSNTQRGWQLAHGLLPHVLSVLS